MPTEFKIGDVVETLDDNIKGVVVAVENEVLKIQTEDDFEMLFKPEELIKIPESELNIIDEDLYEVIQQELKNPKKSISKKEKKPQRIEIDLHIHELIDDARHLSNFEILNIQLNKAKSQLEWAINKRLKYVVFIHGVGQGVLKAELQTLFRRYDNIEFYDANYQTYGLGATEVCIY
mgnify:CR=1 FL=1